MARDAMKQTRLLVNNPRRSGRSRRAGDLPGGMVAMARPEPLQRSHFRVFRRLQTRWADNDIYGHVNNAVHYALFDTAVNGWLIDAGLLDLRAGRTVGLVVETACSYFAEIVFPGHGGCRHRHRAAGDILRHLFGRPVPRPGGRGGGTGPLRARLCRSGGPPAAAAAGGLADNPGGASAMSEADRITALEETVAHQARLIEELSDQLARTVEGHGSDARPPRHADQAVPDARGAGTRGAAGHEAAALLKAVRDRGTAAAAPPETAAPQSNRPSCCPGRGRMRRSSDRRNDLISRPPPKPVSEPSAPMTRWQGMTIGRGFAPAAAPTARAGTRRLADLARDVAIGNGCAVRDARHRPPDGLFERVARTGERHRELRARAGKIRLDLVQRTSEGLPIMHPVRGHRRRLPATREADAAQRGSVPGEEERADRRFEIVIGKCRHQRRTSG